jgi:F-box/leucine-rich repeat protein 7
MGKGRLPDAILVLVFQHLELLDLMRFRLVSNHWWDLLNTSPDILHRLNLAQYNRYVTDEAIRNIIVPFIGSRPKDIDLSNCFHLTDDGFKTLTDACGEGARVWKMKSVWDVQGPAVLALVEKAKGLEEIDLSNCRKVGDNLLARVVGWVVPEKSSSQQPPPPPTQNGKRPQPKRSASSTSTSSTQPDSQPAPGTVIGASKLKRLTLSYCKHVQDRSMAHIAVHASERLEVLDLTRCTSISDAGFHSWSIYEFKNLRKLVLADCTYLSDQAIVGVVGGCRGLKVLDLSFCCALSDTATEVLALGLPALRSLNMAFCGSAVSDNSLRCIGLHLLELRYLSVRGCVRVTGQGVESVVEGCRHLEEFDISQCKNLRLWLDRGGIEKVNGTWGRNVKFDVVANGMWRTAGR